MTDPISFRPPLKIADRSSLLSASSLDDSSLGATLAKVMAVVAILLVVILSFPNTHTPVPLILFGVTLVGFSGIFLYKRNRRSYLPPLFSPPPYIPSPPPRSRFFSWVPSMPSWRNHTTRNTYPNTNSHTAHAAFGSNHPVYVPNSGFTNPPPYASATSSFSSTRSHAAFGSRTPVNVSSSSSSSMNQATFSSNRPSNPIEEHHGNGTHAAFGSRSHVKLHE